MTFLHAPAGYLTCINSGEWVRVPWIRLRAEDVMGTGLHWRSLLALLSTLLSTEHPVLPEEADMPSDE